MTAPPVRGLVLVDQYNLVILHRVKTAISVPDEVFRRAERLAKRRKISRSELYTKALVQLLEGEPKGDVTSAYDAAFSDGRLDALHDEAARRLLETVEWSEE